MRGVDTSQNIYRAPFTKEIVTDVHIAPSWLPGTKLFINADGYNRPVLGPEGMMLQAQPLMKYKFWYDMKPELLYDISGNAFAGTVILSFMITFLVSTAWNADRGEVEESKDDISAIMDAWKRISD